jgi:adenylate cyclase
MMILGSLLIVLSVYYLPIWIGAAFFVASAFLSGLASYYAWYEFSILLDLSAALILYILLFTSASFNNFYIQFKLRQQIKKQFGTYLSPDMVNALQKNPDLLKLGGDRKEMTFLFMDIVGFTPISEYYKNNDDPEGLVELVNEFLDAMTKIILSNGGTIDKYMGDCIMAFWNAPLSCPNHAEMAVKSAIEIEEKTNELKELYKERGLPDINVGTGVNTGDCIVGNMGSETRFDYSVIGDAVNLAARLEATAARHEYIEYKTIISSFTQQLLPEGYVSHNIGTIKVKGKEEEITIYSPKFKK